MAAGEAQLDDIARQLQRGAVARERLASAQEALVAVDVAGYAARARELYGLDPDPHSDGIHGGRVARGEVDLAEVGSRLREAAAGRAEA